MTESPVTLITGGTSGIGAATARRLLDQGQRVCVIGRDVDRLNRFVNDAGAPESLLAITTAAAAGEEVSVSAIARRAGVDRSFLYRHRHRHRHRDLLTQVHTAAEQPTTTTSGGPAVSRASLHADLANCHDRCQRLTRQIRQLETRLSEVLGETVWRATGLGAPDDVEKLTARVAQLEQELADLRLALDDRDAELAAARAANRELMTQLNTNLR
jgi:NAD(P)-dependent dehydrogenase (short-subunit alcohol dehydrogenase family)